MRPYLTAALVPLCCITHAAEAPTTHQEVVLQIILLLQDTEECLATCSDEASVQAALPRLRELAARTAELKEAQRRLPEPTTQDYMLSQGQLTAFNTSWRAIRDHIDRLKKNHLISPELREILHIAPDQE